MPGKTAPATQHVWKFFRTGGLDQVALETAEDLLTLRATTDPDTQALIKDIIATVGGVPDRAGGEGVNAEKVETFFTQVESYLNWLEATASKNIPGLGDATGAACVALHHLRPKVDD